MAGREYVVKAGECLSSIASRNGHAWETLWNHPDNAELKDRRKNPNILCPGDVVFIPDLRKKWGSCGTGKRHVFRRKSVPSKLRLQLMVNNEYRARAAFRLQVDGVEFEGVTDDEGRLEQAIPPDAQKGKLTIVDSGETFDLALGTLDPENEVSGVQARLRNLGYECGDPSGEMNEETGGALESFLAKQGMTKAGGDDPDVQEALRDAHTC